MHIADFVSGSFAGACGVAVGYPLDTVKVRIQTQKQFTGIWQCFVATFSKEGTSVMSPGDIVKVRLQCQTESKQGGTNMPKPKYRGPVHCLLSIIKEEGFMGLYRGALPLMLRDGPSYATYFLTYATICEWLTDGSKKRPDWSGVMFAGGVAGIVGWTIGTPMDVIKARLQVDGARETRRYKGFFHCITETARVEGAGVFFKSLGINCLRAFPVNMVVFVTYEVLTGFLRDGPDSVDPPRMGFE
ncbi:solute carrier family 25 member 47-A isoform X2 [Epinephelus moara]|uniref:solute carrier family 25 member 47-A isoform X2 n=1 Tax=Epinephelus moara TaxID=300413 RepID=UPI00214EF9E7|nr:solute carrier family 25 member 47-A isoform X2 [Epinephelus moara]